MARTRKREYTDINLSEPEIKKIKKGYAVIKGIRHDGNEHWFSIKAQSDRKVHRKIEKLKAEIKRLKAEKK